MSGPSRPLFAASALLLPLAFAGCWSTPSPIDQPPCAPTVQYRAAPPSPPDAGVGMPLKFTAQVSALADAPAGTAIASAAIAIIRDTDEPFRGRSQLPIGTRWLSSTEHEQWSATRAKLDETKLQEHGSAAAVVAPQLSTRLRVADTPIPELRLLRTTSGTQVSLVTEATDDGPREELTIAELIAANDSAALFVPAPQLGLGGYLLELRADTEPSKDEVDAALALANVHDGAATDRDTRPTLWRVAMRAVGEHNRRPALLALCAGHDVPRVTDMLLAADEAALIAISERLANVDVTAEGLGWRIERAAWHGVLPRIEREELTPSMFASVVRQFGAVADDPATLDLMLQTSSDSEAFDAAVIAENLAALADRKTKVRVAAHIWLTARNEGVPDFDPLSDRATRRRALRQHARNRAEQPVEEAR